MQQIPRDNAIVKGCIRAPEGRKIVAMDLTTAEIYVAAVLSKDKNNVLRTTRQNCCNLCIIFFRGVKTFFAEIQEDEKNSFFAAFTIRILIWQQYDTRICTQPKNLDATT